MDRQNKQNLNCISLSSLHISLYIKTTRFKGEAFLGGVSQWVVSIMTNFFWTGLRDTISLIVKRIMTSERKFSNWCANATAFPSLPRRYAEATQLL